MRNELLQNGNRKLHGIWIYVLILKWLVSLTMNLTNMYISTSIHVQDDNNYSQDDIHVKGLLSI